MEKAREIWNDSMTGWRHDKAVAWLDYVSFERFELSNVLHLTWALF